MLYYIISQLMLHTYQLVDHPLFGQKVNLPDAPNQPGLEAIRNQCQTAQPASGGEDERERQHL